MSRKITAGTLAALSMLAFVPPAPNVAYAGSISSSASAGHKGEKATNRQYGNVLDILKMSSGKLHPISDEYPLNEVDCLIFTTISYLPSDFVPNWSEDSSHEGITMAEWYDRLSKYEQTKDEKLFVHREDDHTNTRYIKFGKDKSLEAVDANRKELLKLIARCPRYKDIKVGDFSGKYVAYKSGKKDTEQFAAVTFTLPDGNKVVSFRGTDGTDSGWKENFDFAWNPKVLAQQHALGYLDEIFNISPKSKFFVAGHSKGGHLALYSAFKLCNESKDFKENLVSIFNYDGPGLNRYVVDSLDSEIFDEVSKKMITFIPQSSLIGRIMDYTSKGKLYCVNSTVPGDMGILYQHDTLTWNVSYDYEVKTVENKFESNVIQPESQFMSDATTLFVESVGKERAMQIFVQWVFDFMSRNNIGMDDNRSITQICSDLFYNYFVKNKSVYDMINLVFSPGTAIYLSDEEQQSFKGVLYSTFVSLLKSYWGLHIELNKKMGISPELNKALEELVKSNYSWAEIYNTAKVVRDDVFTWDNIKKFFKKIYGT